MVSITFFVDRLGNIARDYLQDKLKLIVSIDLGLIRDRGEREFQELFKQISSMLKYDRRNIRGTYRSPEGLGKKLNKPCQVICARTDSNRAIRLFYDLILLQDKNPYILAVSIANGDKSKNFIGIQVHPTEKFTRDLGFRAPFDPNLFEFYKARKMRFYDRWFIPDGKLRYQYLSVPLLPKGVYKDPWEYLD